MVSRVTTSLDTTERKATMLGEGLDKCRIKPFTRYLVAVRQGERPRERERRGTGEIERASERAREYARVREREREKRELYRDC